MIWESAPWKDGLLKDADILERWAAKSSKPTQQGVIFEKKIFLAAYAMRKLLEANKICTALHEKPLRFEVYERKDSVMTPWNWSNLNMHYELTSPKSHSRTIWWVFDQIIHSHIFMLTVGEHGRIDGFFVSSDREKDRFLRQISLGQFLGLMREIGIDNPTDSWQWIDENGKWHSENSCPNHPLNR